MVTSRRNRGGRAEELGVTFLEKRGYRIIERNWQGRHGELDVVAERDGVLCFVEIRSRATRRFGTAAESVLGDKQRRLVRTAREWLMRYRAEGRLCRFDVLGIQLETAGPVFELYENAFEASDI